MGVPTLMLFKNGEPAERLTGFQPKKRIQSKIDPHLS
jgi:thioredoxin-like negative regulator of GroEL